MQAFKLPLIIDAPVGAAFAAAAAPDALAPSGNALAGGQGPFHHRSLQHGHAQDLRPA